jgi:hypothetical protein
MWGVWKALGETVVVNVEAKERDQSSGYILRAPSSRMRDPLSMEFSNTV